MKCFDGKRECTSEKKKNGLEKAVHKLSTERVSLLCVTVIQIDWHVLKSVLVLAVRNFFKSGYTPCSLLSITLAVCVCVCVSVIQCALFMVRNWLMFV